MLGVRGIFFGNFLPCGLWLEVEDDPVGKGFQIGNGGDQRRPPLRFPRTPRVTGTGAATNAVRQPVQIRMLRLERRPFPALALSLK